MAKAKAFRVSKAGYRKGQTAILDRIKREGRTICEEHIEATDPNCDACKREWEEQEAISQAGYRKGQTVWIPEVLTNPDGKRRKAAILHVYPAQHRVRVQYEDGSDQVFNNMHVFAAATSPETEPEDCSVPKCTGTRVKGSLCCAAHKGSEYDYGGQALKDVAITGAPGKSKYLVVSFDPDEDQWFYDVVFAASPDAAKARIEGFRGRYAQGFDVIDMATFERMSRKVLAETEEESEKWMRELEAESA